MGARHVRSRGRSDRRSSLTWGRIGGRCTAVRALLDRGTGVISRDAGARREQPAPIHVGDDAAFPPEGVTEFGVANQRAGGRVENGLAVAGRKRYPPAPREAHHRRARRAVELQQVLGHGRRTLRAILTAQARELHVDHEARAVPAAARRDATAAIATARRGDREAGRHESREEGDLSAVRHFRHLLRRRTSSRLLSVQRYCRSAAGARASAASDAPVRLQRRVRRENRRGYLGSPSHPRSLQTVPRPSPSDVQSP